MVELLSDFREDSAKGRDNGINIVTPKVDNNRNKSKPVPNRGSNRRGNNPNQPSNFCKNYKERKKGVPHHEGCYICSETIHLARNRPSLGKLNNMVAAQKQQEKAAMQTRKISREQGRRIGAAYKGKNVYVRLFNHMTLVALDAQLFGVRLHESLFINAKLNGKGVRIMVDTGATHNFVTNKLSKDLGLNYVASNMMLKTVNAHPTIVHGFAPKVLIDLGGWKGLTNFTIAPMDVFYIIMRLDFWYEVNVFISPFINQLHINDARGSCVVCTCPPMLIVKDFKRGRQPFLLPLSEASKAQLRQYL